jgi:hypothetical protein
VRTAGRIAVVHLVRHANGLEPFEAFLRSYRAHDAGREHDLVLLLKGFDDPSDADPYRERAADSRPATVRVDDTGYDLAAYGAAAAQLEHERLCFLNSFSEVRADGWLARLDEALDAPGVGAAGATGSWASHLSYNGWQIGLPDPYANAFENRAAARRAMVEVSGTPYPGDARYWLHSLTTALRDLPAMPRFPAPHLRTNAFLIASGDFRALRWGRPRTKGASYRLESGRRGMTAQLEARGLRTVVADRRGVVRDPPDWHLSDVFWQGGQEELLVADNQTRSYDAAPARHREVLSKVAWGNRARPG